jgi:hypothetical protein
MTVRRLLVGICVAGAALVVAVSASAAPDNAAGPDPAVAEWPEWPYRVTCGSVSFDPVAVFAGATSAERGRLNAERALRRLLASDYLPWLPRHNWRLAGDFHGRADFLHGRLGAELESGLELESLELRHRHHRWKMTTYSSCEPLSLRRGNSASPWFLATNQPALTPDTKRIRVDVGPGYCDGKSASEAEEPVFYELAGKLVMTIWLHPKRFIGPGACEPPPREPSLTVELPEPLGDRELLDGSVYPPRPAMVARSTVNGQ